MIVTPGFHRARPAGPLLVFATTALILAGCGGSSATPAPTAGSGGGAAATQAAPPSQVAAATQPSAVATPAPQVATPAVDGAGVSGATANLSTITSYQFAITMKGGSFGSLLGSEPMTGTVVTSPTKAAHVSIMGMEIIEIDGRSWLKMGTDWIENPDASTSSIVDSLSPEKMFGSALSGAAADGYRAVGEEQKNGVTAVHYAADASMLGDYANLFGVEGNATWSADVWIARDGGFPVCLAVAASGGDEAFEMTFDITHVNDPANKVDAPA